jgi:division protein 1
MKPNLWCSAVRTIHHIRALILYLLGGIDGSVELWNFVTRKSVAKYSGHTKDVICILYDEKQVISGSGDKTIRIFDTYKGIIENN